MEKINFKNSRGLNLAGVLHVPEKKGDSIIIISHGFTSNKDRERFVKLSEFFNKEGFSVLRFDFSGCGESDEDFITVKGEVDDLKSAIRFVRERGYEKIGLLGESLGGLTTLKSYDEIIISMVLWAPVTNKRGPNFEERVIKFNEEVKKENGEFTVHKKDGKEFKIKKEYFEERATINQDELLSKIKCPVLIIHGDKDETIPLDWSESAVEKLPKGSKLEIIKGAGHKLDLLNKTFDLTLNWFKEHLK